MFSDFIVVKRHTTISLINNGKKEAKTFNVEKTNHTIFKTSVQNWNVNWTVKVEWVDDWMWASVRRQGQRAEGSGWDALWGLQDAGLLEWVRPHQHWLTMITLNWTSSSDWQARVNTSRPRRPRPLPLPPPYTKHLTIYRPTCFSFVITWNSPIVLIVLEDSDDTSATIWCLYRLYIHIASGSSILIN